MGTTSFILKESEIQFIPKHYKKYKKKKRLEVLDRKFTFGLQKIRFFDGNSIHYQCTLIVLCDVDFWLIIKPQKIVMKICSRFRMWKLQQVLSILQWQMIQIIIKEAAIIMWQILSFKLASPVIISAAAEETPLTRSIDDSRGTLIHTYTYKSIKLKPKFLHI